MKGELYNENLLIFRDQKQWLFFLNDLHQIDNKASIWLAFLQIQLFQVGYYVLRYDHSSQCIRREAILCSCENFVPIQMVQLHSDEILTTSYLYVQVESSTDVVYNLFFFKEFLLIHPLAGDSINVSFASCMQS